MARDIVLLDQYGTPMELPQKLDMEPQAYLGGQHDRWAAKEARDISPETLARVMKNAAPLSERAAVCDRVYTNGHFLAIAEDFVTSISGLEWDVLPFTASPREKAKPQDKKVADGIAEMLYAAPGLEEYFEHLAWGHGLYPLAAAETIFDDTTFMPVRFELVDAVRFRWDDRTNSLRLLTDRDPVYGEPLKPGLWTVHSRHPQNPRKTKHDRALALLSSIERYVVVDWLSFAEKYGKPIPLAYYSDPKDKESIIEAVLRIGVDFAGVLPSTAKLDLVQAIQASKDIFEGLAKFAHEQSTKIVSGHVLVLDARSGTGTLAGEGAQKTNLKRIRAGAKRLSASVRQGLIRTLAYVHFGPQALNRLPVLQFKTDPPEDQEKKASAYLRWNEALAPSGLMIDPEHLAEVANVPKLIARGLQPGVATGQPPTTSDAEQPDTTASAPAAPPEPAVTSTANVISGGGIKEVRDTLKEVAAGVIAAKAAVLIIKAAGFSHEDAEAMVNAQRGVEPSREPRPQEGEQSAEAAQLTRSRAVRQSESAPPAIRTIEDTIASATTFGTRASQQHTKQILALAQRAKAENLSLAELRDLLFESYDEFDHTKLADVTSQGMALAATQAAAEVIARRNSVA